MKFTYNGADLRNIIKTFENKENMYKIAYLDGTSSNYTCFNGNEIQRIKDIMINQAKDRQDNMDIRKFKLMRDSYFSGCIISSFTISVIQNSNTLLSYLLFIFLMFSMNGYRDKKKKIKELKKYKLFLELLPYLNEVNTFDILKSIEFDNIYQKPLDITTLDEYSYSQVKTIYKTYKLKK